MIDVRNDGDVARGYGFDFYWHWVNLHGRTLCEAVSDMAADETLPVVVIVGRPNVGKSTLFNAIIGNRRSIVGDEPGITRDRIYGEAEYRGKRFGMIDTGGIIPHDAALIPSEILKQAQSGA